MYASYWNLSQEESLDFGEISRRTENAEKGLDEAGFLDPARVFLLTPARLRAAHAQFHPVVVLRRRHWGHWAHWRHWRPPRGHQTLTEVTGDCHQLMAAV